MTIELVFGLLGTISSMILLGREAIKVLRARAESDAVTTREAIQFASKAREDTGQHLTKWVDCEQRCRELTDRCARLEAENEKLRERVEVLERKLDDLKERFGVVDSEPPRLKGMRRWT